MNQDRQLAAIMFTDIVGYSGLMEKDENEALYLLEINRQIIHETLKKFNGRCAKEIGDGTLSTFNSTVDALACATKILKIIDEYPQLNLRIALHLADVIQEEKDVFGDGVNIAARLEALAPTNGIAISQHFYSQIQGKTSCRFKSIGFPKLKNISAKIEVFTWQPSNDKQSNNTIEKVSLKNGFLSFKQFFSRYKLVFAAFFFITLGYFAWSLKWLNFNSELIESTQQVNSHESSIAVLKFKNIGESIQDHYFNEGLSEELLNLLARIKELKVASRTSTWALPENVTSAMVKQQLNVNYMVEGSIRKSGNNIRITVQLIETTSGFHLWSETYDRELGEIFSLQDEIALNITESLKLLLSAQSLKAINADKQVNTAALESYLKAKQFLRQPKIETNIIGAIEAFKQAILIEENFELALAGLCKAQIEFYQLTLSNNDFTTAEKNCLTILKSNTYQSDVYSSLGDLYLVAGNFVDAQKNYQAALTLDSSSVDALIGLALLNAKLNEHKSAQQYFLRAIRTVPNSSEVHGHYGSYLFFQGKNTQAIEQFKKVIALTPNYGAAYNSLGAAYFASGNIEKGIEVFEQSLKVNATHEAYSNLGTAYYIQKKFKQAAQMYQQAIALLPSDYRYWGFLGESYEHIANKEQETKEAYLQAIQKAEQVLSINERDQEVIASLALYSAKTDQPLKANKFLEQLVSKELVPELLYTMSISYLALEDVEQSVNFLKKAVDKGYDKATIYADENFIPLHSNPKFKEIIN